MQNKLLSMRKFSNKKLSYSDEEKRRDAIAYERLQQMAIDDAKDPNNYKNLVCK